MPTPPSTTVNRPTRFSAMSVAIFFGATSSVMSMVVFLLCRFDHDMKLLALGNVLGQITALMATCSTMLVGRDFSFRQDSPSADLPPGGKMAQTTLLEAPPLPETPPPAQ